MANSADQTKILTLKEASELTGYHQDYLGQLCRSGKLRGTKMGKGWFTSEAALHEFLGVRIQNQALSQQQTVPGLQEALVKVTPSETVNQTSESPTLANPISPAEIVVAGKHASVLSGVLRSILRPLLTPLIFSFLVTSFAIGSAAVLLTTNPEFRKGFAETITPALMQQKVVQNDTSENQTGEDPEIVVVTPDTAKQEVVVKEFYQANPLTTAYLEESISNVIFQLLDAGRLTLLQGETGPMGPQGPAGKPGAKYSVTNINLPSQYDSLTISSLLGDDANFTDDVIIGDDLTVNGTITAAGISGTIDPSFTLGSVPFQGVTGLAEDNANFFYDDSLNALGVGSNSIVASALLQLDSTSKGFLPPRLTTAQKNAIGSPAEGLTIFDSDLNKLNVYNGTEWKNVGSAEIGGEITSGTTGSILFVGAGATIAQDNANFFWDDSNNRLGIGTLSPAATIHSLATTEQLRLGYDASNYASFTTSATGDLTIAPSGSDLDLTGDLNIANNGNSNALTISRTLASTGSYPDDGIVKSTVVLNPSSGVAISSVTGAYNLMSTQAANANNLGTIYQNYNEFGHNGTGTISSYYANYDYIDNYSTGNFDYVSGNYTGIFSGGDSIDGSYLEVYKNAGDTTAGTVRGQRIYVSNIGAVNASESTYGSWIAAERQGGVAGGTYNLYGQYIAVAGSPTGTTTAYGLYIDYVNLSDTRYSIYSNAAVDSYFAGEIGIGDTTPGAALVVGSDATMGVANGAGDGYFQNDLEVDGTVTVSGTTIQDGGSSGWLTFTKSQGRGYKFTGDTASNSAGEYGFIAEPGVIGAGAGGWFDLGTNSSYSSSTGAATDKDFLRVASGATFAPTSGTGVFYGIRLIPTINMTGTSSGHYEALKINVTETALLGSGHKLISVGTGGGTFSEKFRVENDGDGYFAGALTVAGSAAYTGALSVITTTSPQLTVGYDSSNKFTTTTASDGGTTWAMLGTDADLNIDFSGATDGDFSINSDDLFVDTSTGYVGIGDSTPDYALDVEFSTSNTTDPTVGGYFTYTTSHAAGTRTYAVALEADAYHTGDGITNNLIGITSYASMSGTSGAVENLVGFRAFGNARSAGTVNNNYGIYLDSQAGIANGSGTDYQIYSATASPFVVRSDGNIGIGDSSPAAALTVGLDTTAGVADGAGDVYVQNDLEVDGTLTVAGATTYSGALSIITTSSPQLTVGYDSSNKFTTAVASDGGTTWAMLGTDADLNIDFSGATDGDFSINTDDLFVDTSTGYVGIGTASPVNALDVVNSFRVQGNAGASVGATGKGLELTYNTGSNTAYIYSYDRTGAAYTGLRIEASATAFSQGKVVVGPGITGFTSGDNGEFEVASAVGLSSYVPNMTLTDTTAMAAGVGGTINFNGFYSTNPGYADFAAIQGFKENATDNNYAGALRFFTRCNGCGAGGWTGNSQERMRIDSNGYVGIGDTAPDQILEVMSSAAANTQLTISNTNAGDYDAQIGFELADGTSTFTIGVDDSVNTDPFVIASSTALGTNNRLTIDSAGSMGLGGNYDTQFALSILGNAGNVGGAYLATSTTVAANNMGWGFAMAPTLVEAGSGTHSLFSSLYVDRPAITNNAATLTEATTVYIQRAPTAGVSNYALHVDDGTSRFDGDVNVGSEIVLDTYGRIYAGAANSQGLYPGVDAGFVVTPRASTPSAVGMVVQGLSSQSGDLTQWRNSGTSVIASVNASGGGYFAAVTGINDTSPDASLEVVNDGVGDSFLVADTNDGDTSPFVIQADGDVGIGIAAPTYRLDVETNTSSTYAAYFFNDGDNADRYGIQIQGGADDASGTTYYLNALDGNGDQIGYIANTSGTFALTDVSDRRTKTNINDTDVVGLDTILQLEVVDFNRLADPDGPRITGFIAQQVQKVYPNIVTQGKNGYLGITKENLIPVLVKAIQEQQEQLQSVKVLAQSLQGSSEGTLEVESLTVNGHVVFNEDTVGQAQILADDTKVRINFTEQYEYQPVVTITPTEFVDVPYRVTDIDVTGFTIELANEVGYNVAFNWHSFASKDGKLTISDGTIENITIVIPEPAPEIPTFTQIFSDNSVQQGSVVPVPASAEDQVPAPIQIEVPAEQVIEELPTTEQLLEPSTPEAVTDTSAE